MAGVYEHEAWNDRDEALGLAPMIHTQRIELGDEVFQSVLAHEPVFGSLLVFIGSHDIPFNQC